MALLAFTAIFVFLFDDGTRSIDSAYWKLRKLDLWASQQHHRRRLNHPPDRGIRVVIIDLEAVSEALKMGQLPN
jgi:hypothetical protein